MLVEEQKLRWCGIDMRARWRRRVAVVLTYALFLFLVWGPSGRMYGVAIGLMWICVLRPIFSLRKDLGTGMRWAVWALLAAMSTEWIMNAWHTWFHGADKHHWMTSAIAMLVLGHSVLGIGGGLVDHGRPNWMAEAIRNGGELSWRKQRRLARRGFGIGLDGFAWYEYGMRFHRLNAEQKEEIEALRQAYPRGKWMREHAGVLFDDERLKNEEARLRARVQKVMSWVLVSMALVGSVLFADGERVSASVVVASLWTLAGMVTTLRQAMVLWVEDDPRMAGGEITVVDGVGAL